MEIGDEYEKMKFWGFYAGFSCMGNGLNMHV